MRIVTPKFTKKLQYPQQKPFALRMRDRFVRSRDACDTRRALRMA